MGLLFETFGPLFAWRAARQYPAFNVYDIQDRYIVMAELPGLTAKDIELTVAGEALTVLGARHRSAAIPDDAYRRQERPFGAWSRTFTLPGKVDADRVEASLALGVLRVVVPKADDPKPRQITVTMVGS
jgi:HSP20 family protein